MKSPDSSSKAVGVNEQKVIVASHRRSGTHLVLEYLNRIEGVRTIKTHQMAEPLRQRHQTAPAVYVVRNPFDTLWSTYKWFAGALSNNGRIAARLADLDFPAFLAGAAGERLGFAAWRDRRADSLAIGSGMFYDPIRYWFDHVSAGINDSTFALVRYEQLVADPVAELGGALERLGIEGAAITPRSRADLVGHAPSVHDDFDSLVHWPAEAVDRVDRLTASLMDRIDQQRRPVRTMVVVNRSPPRVRYVCRSDHSGYATAGRRCVAALAAAGVDVVWEPELRSERVGPPRGTPADLLQRYQPDASVDLTIAHVMPGLWAATRSALSAERFIGHTVWELEAMPRHWFGELAVADRIWVPTEFTAASFRSAGVPRPIDVVPHAVASTDIAPPVPLQSVGVDQGRFVVATVCSWHPRKRPDANIRAFLTAFDAGDPVELIVKTDPWVDAWPTETELEKTTWYQTMRVVAEFPNPAKVTLVIDRWTDAEIDSLLTQANCVISLAASEGWGLGLFDAAVHGTPVVTTGYGAHLEWLGHDHGGLVDSLMVEVPALPNSPHFQPGMQWADPSVDHAARLLRAVYERLDEARADAAGRATQLRERFSQEQVGALAARLVGEALR